MCCRQPDEVKAGATPRYIELGGYAYRRTSEKFDIEFLDDGNRVRYMEKTCVALSPRTDFLVGPRVVSTLVVCVL